MIGAGAGAVRLTRALAFTAAAVMLTTGAHRLGGSEVPVVAIAVFAAACWPAALLASSRRVRLPHLLIGLGSAQALGHGLLMYAGHRAMPTGLGDCLASTPHVGHVPGAAAGCGQHVADHATYAAHAAGSAAAMGEMLTIPMLALHVAAVGVLALTLAKGETLLWRVLDALAPALLAPVTFARSRPAAPHTVSHALHRHLLLVGPRRGPPVTAA